MPPSGRRLVCRRGLVGQQKTVEWLEQTLNQNIAQRVALTLRQFDLADHPDRCVIVIDVPISPRAPHMVTYQQDNRYYRRYYKRHHFESLPVEEYEVREMFQRSLRFTDAVNALLDERGYLDRGHADFGRNPHTALLADRPHLDRAAATFVSFVAVPNIPTPDALDLSSESVEQWLDAARGRRHPFLGSTLLPFQSRFTLDGRLFTDALPPAPDGVVRWREFVFIGRNGYVEYATSRFSWDDRQGNSIFALTPIVGYGWTFVSFVCGRYHLAGPTGSLRLLCNLANTEGSYLSSFGRGWAEPDSSLYRSSPSLDQHIQIVQELPNPDLDEDAIEGYMRHIDLRIENAYNYNGPLRSFNYPNSPTGGPDAGKFALEQFRRWLP